jgi:hypothetical protein
MHPLLKVSIPLVLGVIAVAGGCTGEPSGSGNVATGGNGSGPCEHVCEVFEGYTVNCSSTTWSYDAASASDACAFAQREAADGGIAGMGGAGGSHSGIAGAGGVSGARATDGGIAGGNTGDAGASDGGIAGANATGGAAAFCVPSASPGHGPLSDCAMTVEGPFDEGRCMVGRECCAIVWYGFCQP